MYEIVTTYWVHNQVLYVCIVANHKKENQVHKVQLMYFISSENQQKVDMIVN